jgi:hypothetical protein
LIWHKYNPIEHIMGRLQTEIEQTLPAGMSLPEPLKRLYDWIETNGFVDDSFNNRRTGQLCADYWEGSTETERYGGTAIDFYPEGNEDAGHWTGSQDPAVHQRIYVFAKTGADGSVAALWLAPDGTQKIVHMGSGSGSTMYCVLADDPIDFLRLIAIGYDEICFVNNFNAPPNVGENTEAFIHPNVGYQAWVCETFNVTIPQTAAEIIKYPADCDDEDSPDIFWQWLKQLSGGA